MPQDFWSEIFEYYIALGPCFFPRSAERAWLNNPTAPGSQNRYPATCIGSFELSVSLSEHEFSALYAPIGRPSIPPEKLLRAMLLQAFYSIRSERQLMERLEYDLLFRWFVGIGVDVAVWDHSVFSKNRDRLLEGNIAARFLAAVLDQPRVKKLLSTDHFTVDGTLIEAWASLKSFKPRDGSDDPPAGGGRNTEADFHGKKRSNETHVSTTDPDARLYRKGPGKEAKLCFIGHGLMENRHGLLVDACLTPADGHAERVAALAMIEPRADRPRAITLGADKAYDAEDFVNELRSMTVTPHVAQNTSGRSSAIDARTTRHGGYGTCDGSACAEFSWEGNDENDPASGRGWVVLGTAGRLVGHFYIHNGDDTGFVCDRA